MQVWRARLSEVIGKFGWAALALLAASPALANGPAPQVRMGVLVHVQEALARLKATVAPILDAMPTIPSGLVRAGVTFGQDPGQSVGLRLAGTAVLLIAMVGAARLGRSLARRWLGGDHASGAATAIFRRFFVDVAGLLACLIVAVIGVELIAFDDGLLSKLSQSLLELGALLTAAIIFPAILFRPGEPELRLVAASEASIAGAAPWAGVALVCGIAFPTIIPVILEAGLPWASAQGLALLTGLTIAILILIASRIFAGEKPHLQPFRSLIPLMAVMFLLVWSYGVINLDFPFYFLVIRMAALLGIGFLLDRLLTRLSTPIETGMPDQAGTAASIKGRKALTLSSEFWTDFGLPIRRFLRVACASSAIYIIALWLTEAAPALVPGQNPTGFVSGMAGALVTLNIGYAIFEGLSSWTKVRYTSQIVVQKPGGDDEDIAPASRLATVMPVLQGLIGIFVLGVTVLMALPRVGVDTTPILAGAGILGLAVSFGSQSLVKDVVAGIFYMVDDAFRLGEYIEASKLKGSVEKISIRSVQLRHHNGQLHTVPFGQLGSITNYSRDWITLKFNLRMSRDIDIEVVRKTVKRVGQELLLDPEFGKEFILPLKMQGVADIQENAMVVRLKFTARPGKPTYVQREALKRVILAFNAEGIKFAQNAIVVQTNPGEEPSDEAEAAGAVSGMMLNVKSAPG